MTEVSRLQKLNAFISPASLAVLAILGLTRLSSFPSAQLNSFDQAGVVGLIAGGVAGIGICVWNLALLKSAATPVKQANLTISAAVFGFLFSVMYGVVVVIQIVLSTRPKSELVVLIFLTTVGQFLVIMSWAISKSVPALRTISLLRRKAPPNR